MGNFTTKTRTWSPATAIRLAALVIAMMLVSATMVQRSQSAFTGTTSYGSGMTAATVSLESSPDVALDVGNMVPGDSIVRCVDVSYAGTATQDQLDSVRVYATHPLSDGGLAPHLMVRAEVGNAGTNCADAGAFAGVDLGTLDSVYSSNSSYGTAADSYWTPSTSLDSKRFRFTVTMPATTADAAQGKSTSPTITWEIRTKSGTAR